jgi:hypothetical protein
LARARAANPSFFDVTPEITKTVRGIPEIVPEQWMVNRDEKPNLCEWLCEHGTAYDFRGFCQLLEFIREVLPK